MTTRVDSSFVDVGSRTLATKLADFINAADYGAATANSAALNTSCINSAITTASSAGQSGFVVVSPGVSYTEASLVIPDGVVLIVFSTLGTVTYLTKDQGTSLPVTKGGLVIKSQGNTGVMLRSLDYGVTGEPILQVVDATSGDIAAFAPKFNEFVEITDPTAPSANKARLYTKDDGANNTTLAIRFATGNVINICKEGQKSNIFASTTWDPGNITNNSSETKQVAAVGAAMGDFVLASFSLDLQNLTISAHVTATDLVDVVLQNATGGAVDLASGTLSVLVIKNW